MKFQKHSIFFLGFFLFSLFQAPAFAAKKAYIVYLGSHAHEGREATTADFERATDSHYELLGSYLGSPMKAKESIFYSYTRHINGFAAMLDEEVAADIAEHPDVLSVFLSQERKLHTTRSWEFMGMAENGVALPESAFKKARFGEDTIIGNLDTGVWPESLSFADEGMGPIPARWKGSCVVDDPTGFHCNRKLIGARYFNKGFLNRAKEENDHLPKNTTIYYTARDTGGHGSHTLSTAGGNMVPGANIFGLAKGTASGGSPKARVAAYKVCWPPISFYECLDADIVAGFDMAIHDGVDVLSVSLGGYPTDFRDDLLAIASFHAFKKGITVVCSGGNSGPYATTVTNFAPWIFTIAASTLDREFETAVQLQNGKQFQGKSRSIALPEKKLYPLILASHAKTATANVTASLVCEDGSLDPKRVNGKILVCLRGLNLRMEKSNAAQKAGAVGMILYNDKSNNNETVPDPFLLPSAHINYEDGLQLVAYLNSARNPMGYIYPPKDKFQKKPSPYVASFSSRGPSFITSEILKPDVTAPGVNIIAAFSQVVAPTAFDFDKRRVPYTLMSGTSMSCPHVSGVVGLLKTLHPDWSSSAIKSAIMTTARTRDNTGHPMLAEETMAKATPFDYGAGHIRPNKAADPGLVYDLTINDYLDFLCALGYNQTWIKLFSGAPHTCPYSMNLVDFNYPSISIPTLYGSVNVTRTLKNVGSPGTYSARIHPISGVAITVEPNVLKFEKIGEEKSFKLKIEVKRHGTQTAFGGLTWSDGKHFVRSPIAVGGVNVD